MARVTLRPDLNQVIARMIAPQINEAAHETAQVAKELAPPTKRWFNQGDDGVRTQHVHAEGQEVPDNIRFKLPAYEWDVKHPGVTDSVVRVGDGSGWTGPQAKTVPGVHSYLLEPRDHTGGAYIAIVNCRCGVVKDPQGIAQYVTVKDAVPTGTNVKALVVADGPGVTEAEHGDVYPFPVTIPVAKGTLFMHRAAVVAANTIRARQ